MKLYHYTDRAGAQGIVQSGVIQANNGIGGYGVYFTSLGPKTGKLRLVINNYDDGNRIIASSWGKVEFWFEFESSDLFGLKHLKQGDRDIYMVPNDVPVYNHAVAMHY